MDNFKKYGTHIIQNKKRIETSQIYPRFIRFEKVLFVIQRLKGLHQEKKTRYSNKLKEASNQYEDVGS